MRVRGSSRASHPCDEACCPAILPSRTMMWRDRRWGCGGGPARPPYETIAAIELVTGASPRGHPSPARIHSHEMVTLTKLASVRVCCTTTTDVLRSSSMPWMHFPHLTSAKERSRGDDCRHGCAQDHDMRPLVCADVEQRLFGPVLIVGVVPIGCAGADERLLHIGWCGAGMRGFVERRSSRDVR